MTPIEDLDDGQWNGEPDTIDARATGLIVTSQNNNGSGVDPIMGSTTFNGNVDVWSNIIGNVTVNGSSFLDGGQVTGNATFNVSGYNNATVTGNARFNYLNAVSGMATDTTGYGSGAVGGTITDSVGAPITTWIFNTTDNRGVVTGNAIFKGSHLNMGTVTGNSTYLSLTAVAGAVYNATNGYVQGATYDSTGAPITTWIFTTDPPNSFANPGGNSNAVTGTAIFNDVTRNVPQHTVYGDAIFNGASLNIGIVTGDAIFNDTSQNMLRNVGPGTVNGTITFNYDAATPMIIFGNETRVVSLGGSASFNFSMFTDQAVTCSSCTYSVSVSPSVPIDSVNQTGNSVSGSFTPTRLGSYALIITVRDATHRSTATLNDTFYVVRPAVTIASTTQRYYWRSLFPSGHSTITGTYFDTGSLRLTAPTTTETRFCAVWVQDMIDELPVVTPLSSLITNASTHDTYTIGSAATLSLQEYGTYSTDVDLSAAVPSAGSNSTVDRSFPTINWVMPKMNDWYLFSEKLVGAVLSGPVLTTTSGNPSYIDISYSYTKTPFLTAVSGTEPDLILLSATAPDNASTTNSTLVFYNPLSVATSTTISVGNLQKSISFYMTVNGAPANQITTDSGGSTSMTFSAPANSTTTINISTSPLIVPPDAPTSISASVGNAQATISFSAPGNNGGSAVLYYLASSSPGSFFATSTNPTITVSGLTNGTSYTFQVYAINIAGTSTPSSQSNSVTPVAPSNPAPPAPLPSSGSTSGGSVSASTLASLLAPSAATTAYLKSLMPSLVPGCPPNTTCTPTQTAPAQTVPAKLAGNGSSFKANLQMGDTGQDIRTLQKYLNTHGFTVSTAGPGSPGHETLQFGQLTVKALMKFQKSHGLPSTGFFGPLTRALLNKL